MNHEDLPRSFGRHSRPTIATLRRLFPSWTWEAERAGNVFTYRGKRVALQGSELEHVQTVIVRNGKRSAYVDGAWMFRGSVFNWNGDAL